MAFAILSLLFPPLIVIYLFFVFVFVWFIPVARQSPFMWIFGPLLILFFIFSMGCHSPYMNGHNPCLSPLHGLEGRDWEKEKKMHTLNFMFNFIFHSINVWCGALDSRHTFCSTATYSTAHIMNIYFAFDKHSSHILLCISFFILFYSFNDKWRKKGAHPFLSISFQWLWQTASVNEHKTHQSCLTQLQQKTVHSFDFYRKALFLHRVCRVFEHFYSIFFHWILFPACVEIVHCS